MYALNIAKAIKQLLFNKKLEKKRFIVACKQINKKST